MLKASPMNMPHNMPRSLSRSIAELIEENMFAGLMIQTATKTRRCGLFNYTCTPGESFREKR
jgi:hypothetical protein